MQEAVYYLEAQAPTPPAERVRVVDLSLRNLLARPIVDAVVDRLTHERFYEGLHEADPARFVDGLRDMLNQQHVAAGLRAEGRWKRVILTRDGYDVFSL